MPQWPGQGSNLLRQALQACALPVELPGHYSLPVPTQHVPAYASSVPERSKAPDGPRSRTTDLADLYAAYYTTGADLIVKEQNSFHPASQGACS